MINLSAYGEKQNYQMELNRRLVVFYSVGILVVIAIFIGLLLSINAYLTIQHTLLSEEIISFERSPKTIKIQSMELTVQNFIEHARQLQGVKRTLVPLHPLLRDIESAIAQGITLNGISLDLQNNKGTVVGFAQTRNDVIAFQSNLEKVSWISAVDSPLSNLIRERDISFTFAITIKVQ